MGKPNVGDIVRLKPSAFHGHAAYPAATMCGDLMVAEIHPPSATCRHTLITVLCDDGQYRVVERASDLEGFDK